MPVPLTEAERAVTERTGQAVRRRNGERNGKQAERGKVNRPLSFYYYNYLKNLIR